jgi:hypothetical protein
MGRLGRATFTVNLISAPDQPGRKQMYILSIFLMIVDLEIVCITTKPYILKKKNLFH